MAIIRVSSPGQRSGHGPERQEFEEIAGYVEELGGRVVERVAVQESGVYFSRPHFETAIERGIEKYQRGEIDRLMCGSVERLGRDAYKGGALVVPALQAGLPVLFAREKLNAMDEAAQPLIVQSLLTAKANADRIKKQTLPARRARAKRGMIPNGQVRWPFDYDQGSGRATPNPQRAAHVRRWVGDIQNNKALRVIARGMEERGIPAPKGGVKWSPSTLTRILRDRSLVGEFRHGHERMVAREFFEPTRRVKQENPELVYVDRENAILGEVEFNSIQARLDQNKALASRNQKRNFGPFARMLSCVPCGRKLRSDWAGGWPSFRCRSCGLSVPVVETTLDLKANLIEMFADPSNLFRHFKRRVEEGWPAEDLERRRAEAEDELASVGEERARAFRLAVKLGGRHEELVVTTVAALDARERSARSVLAEAERQLGELAAWRPNDEVLWGQVAGMAQEMGYWTDEDWKAFVLTAVEGFYYQAIGNGQAEVTFKLRGIPSGSLLNPDGSLPDAESRPGVQVFETEEEARTVLRRS